MYVDITLCVPRDFPGISQGNLLIYLEFSLFGIGSMKGHSLWSLQVRPYMHSDSAKL